MITHSLLDLPFHRDDIIDSQIDDMMEEIGHVSDAEEDFLEELENDLDIYENLRNNIEPPPGAPRLGDIGLPADIQADEPVLGQLEEDDLADTDSEISDIEISEIECLEFENATISPDEEEKSGTDFMSVDEISDNKDEIIGDEEKSDMDFLLNVETSENVEDEAEIENIREGDECRSSKLISEALMAANQEFRDNANFENESLNSCEEQSIADADGSFSLASGSPYSESVISDSENSNSSDKSESSDDVEERNCNFAHPEEEDDCEFVNVYQVKEKYAPKIKVVVLNTPDGSETGYRHEVVWPVNSIEVPLLPIETPAKSYKFVLDPFQNAAVVCIDNYQSVLISAHTSAGKTIAAEYAIAKALKDNQRVIYTTPVKALSNQKYREFSQEFTDVGIITGDISINTSASCLIMTTEILRQMLYRGSEVTREVGWVIFDEIHYMKDKRRGVIWEETIILLPHKAHFVFLSATIPNATQFAEWVVTLHDQPCNVIHTNFRPIPLCHYIYPSGGEQVIQVVRGNAQTTNVVFNDDGFNAAMMFLATNDADSRHEDDEESPVIRLVTKIISEGMTPIIVFSFSRKECETYAVELSKLDFNNDEEKGLISEVFLNAVSILSDVDQSLPQVLTLLPLLKRGLGIHHSGLLPIMKETIEILFSEGLIKILFATETFAMGLNMPAHTVVFTNTKKFDGKSSRLITAGEYIQMSGRAGRRSYDKCGTSIVMLREIISIEDMKNMIMGQPDPIDSSFRLTYNMILSLIRGSNKSPEYMMRKSFLEFQHRSLARMICDRIIAAEQECAKYTVINREVEIASYYMIRRDLAVHSLKYDSMIRSPEYIVPFLQSGRLASISSNGRNFGWGVIINCTEKNNNINRQKSYIVEVLCRVSIASLQTKKTTDLQPATNETEQSSAVIIPLLCSAIIKLSKIRLNCPSDLRPENNRISLMAIVDKAVSDFKGEIPILDPINDMKITDPKFLHLVKVIGTFEEKLKTHPLYKHEDLPALYNIYHKKMKAYDDLYLERKGLKKYNALLNTEELKKRKRVLRKLGYLSPEDLIEIKGRVACELTGCDEILLTELMFCGVFLALDVPECVALLSCFVCTEKSNTGPPEIDDLKKSFELLQKVAENIGLVSQDCNLLLDPKEYVDSFKPALMNVVYEWCKGSTFAKLFEITDIYEGTIIRCMTALNEILIQMSQAAKVIENKELEGKFKAGMKLIKRDIVFAASLYL